MTFSCIYFFSGTWTPLVAVIITLIPGKYLFMSWRPHLCQSTSLVFKVKRPARHLKTFLLLHLKKRKGPSQWRLPKVITTKELGSSIFQEIILNHKCPPHCHCLHGFRNSEHVKKNNNLHAVYVHKTLISKMPRSPHLQNRRMGENQLDASSLQFLVYVIYRWRQIPP